MSPRRFATVVAVLGVVSAVAWALMELGSTERAPVAPIVMREHSGMGPGTNTDEGPVPSQPGGSGGDPSSGAEPPPAPPPPLAGGDDDGGDDADD